MRAAFATAQSEPEPAGGEAESESAVTWAPAGKHRSFFSLLEEVGKRAAGTTPASPSTAEAAEVGESDLAPEDEQETRPLEQQREVCRRATSR